MVHFAQKLEYYYPALYIVAQRHMPPAAMLNKNEDFLKKNKMNNGAIYPKRVKPLL